MAADVSLPRTTTSPDELRLTLRAAVLRELSLRELDDADTLAERLNILPITAAGILRRSTWPVETSLWLIRELQLPVHVVVQGSR